MKKHYALLLFIFSTFAINCSSDPSFVEETMVETKGPVGPGGGGTGPAGPESAFDDYKEGPVLLGKDLSVIYSVDMMRAAYNEKYPNGGGQYGPSAIRTTHYYVRFLPKNEDEYDTIVKYDLSEIPLYSEIVKGGSSYHDPSIPVDQYTWQYALIPVNEFESTSVQYEILQSMFIVNYGLPGVPGPGGAPSYTFWEALEIINHKHETGEDIGPGILWTPSGKIEVYDDLLQKYIPLENLTVYISADGYRPQTVFTDATGAFKSKWTYTTSVYYKVYWKGHSFSFEIKDGAKDQAYLVSNRSYKPFRVRLNDNNLKQKNLATIYRAGVRAYYKDYLNMERPFVKAFTSGRILPKPIRIAYSDWSGGSSIGIYHLNAGSLNKTKPNISIRETDMSSDRLFGTVTHELAHAGHHIKFPNYQWTIPNQIIHESWASAVEYYITKLEYADYGKDIDTYDEFTVDLDKPVTYLTHGSMAFVTPSGYNRQYWPLVPELQYSPLVIDLIDSDNQALYYKLKPLSNYGYKMFPNDNVMGFDLDKIQTTLGANGLTEFKNKVKIITDKYYNYTDRIDIDTLFNRYEHYWNK